MQQFNFGDADANRRIAELLAEDPEIAAEREEWENKLKKLELIQNELRAFGV